MNCDSPVKLNSMDDRAMKLVEWYCKQSFRPTPCCDQIPLTNGIGRLKQRPFSIGSVLARSNSWEHSKHFGSSDWVEIPLQDVSYQGVLIHISGTVLGTMYDEAKVEYLSGYASTPEPILEAVDKLEATIAELSTDNFFLLSTLISVEIAELIHPYRLGR